MLLGFVLYMFRPVSGGGQVEAESFERLKRRLDRDLTVPQCLELVTLLQTQAHARLGEVAVQRRTEMVLEVGRCVRCGSRDIVKHGLDANGRQRFRCRGEGGCGRTFNPMTGTVLARMRQPGKWVAYAAEMADHKSVANVVAGDLGVAPLTAFRWRHKLLEAQSAKPLPMLAGVVEADETYFRTSYKGSRGWKRGTPPENRPPRYRGGSALKRGLSGEQVPVLTALDRSGATMDRVLVTRTEIADELIGRIAPGSILCTDGLAAYKAVAALCESEHRRINPPVRMTPEQKAKGGEPRKHGRLGLGMVNAHHQRIRNFVNRRANGVSTKYLDAYLSWNRAVRRPGFATKDLILDALIHS